VSDREKQMHDWLVTWFNHNAAGDSRCDDHGDNSDTTLVLMAFNLQKLAKDLTEQWH
jgi:hypothetical protein